MDLEKAARHKARKWKYERKAREYSQAASKLRRYSETAGNHISKCEENLKEIKADMNDSYGDVICNFKDGIDNYKSKISNVINEASSSKAAIDRAIREAEAVARKYRRMAEDEDRKSRES